MYCDYSFRQTQSKATKNMVGFFDLIYNGWVNFIFFMHLARDFIRVGIKLEWDEVIFRKSMLFNTHLPIYELSLRKSQFQKENVFQQVSYQQQSKKMNQIFFVYFGQNIKWKDVALRTFLNRPTFALYTIFWLSITSFIHSQISNDGQQLANAPLLVFQNNEYYRIVTAPFAIDSGFQHLFWLVSSLWWLLSILPQHENKYSSIHLLVQLFLQNLLLQVAYCVFVVLFVTVTGVTVVDDQFISMGWDPLILIWVFLLTGAKKQDESRLFFLPIKIKNQILAWVLACWTILFAHQKAPLVIATILGSLQFHTFNRSIVKAPFTLYLFLESPLLNCSKYFSSFVTLQSAKQNLQPLYATQMDQIYGKEQYKITSYTPKSQDLIVFEGEEIVKASPEKIHQEIDKWIARDEKAEELAIQKEKKSGTASIFEIDDDL